MALSTDPSATGDSQLLVGFLTPSDLAQQLGISPRTLARWHAQRIGPARCRVGRLILYRVEAVRAWMIEQERGQSPIDRRRRR